MILTLATIGLGVDTIRGLPNASVAWTEHISGKAYRIDVRLARENRKKPYKCLDFIYSAPADVESLNSLHPGVADSFAHQMREHSGSDVVPIAILTHTWRGEIVNLTTLVCAFDITRPIPYPPNFTVEDAERQLQAYIHLKVSKS